MNEDLTDGLDERGRRLFTAWRELGLSESAARAAVVEAGHAPRASGTPDRLAVAFAEMGLSEAVTRRAATGREPGPRTPAIAPAGLSEAWDGAVRAAMRFHRMSEYAARCYLRDKAARGEWASLGSPEECLEALRSYARTMAPDSAPAHARTSVSESFRPSGRSVVEFVELVESTRQPRS